MPGNVLTATIKVNTQGVKQSFQETGTAAKKTSADLKSSFSGFATGAITETKQVIKSLTAEISQLDATLLRSKGGRALSSELALAKNELKALEKQAAITGVNTGNTLTKGFSALRQLAFILPGIGIAGIFNVAFEGIGKLIDSFSALPAAAATVEDFNQKFAAGAGKDIALIELLKAKINDSNTTQAQRVELVKDYNREADRGNQIDVTQIGNIDVINEKILQQISLLKERAKVKAAENVIAGKFEELFKRELDVEVKFPGLSEVLSKATNAVEAANQKLKIKPTFDVKELLALVDLPQEQLDNLAKGADRLKALGDPEVVKRLQNANRELSTFFNAVGGKRAFTSSSQKIFLDQAQKDVDDTLALFAKLLTVEGFSEKEKERVAKVFEGIKVSIVKGLNDTVNLLELNPTKLSLPFQLAIDEGKLTTQFSFVKKQLEDKLSQFALKPSIIPVSIQLQIKDNANDFSKLISDNIKRLNEQIKSISSDFGQSISHAFAEGINNAISGSGLQGVFGPLLSVIADALQRLGEAAITTAIGITAIQAAFDTLNPAVAFAAGIALIALSAVVRKAVSGISVREKGGPVFRGQVYGVNERGQELFQPNQGQPFLIKGGPQLFTPPVSGKIIPHWQTEKILNSYRTTKVNTSKVYNSISHNVKNISGNRAAGGAVVAGNNYIVNEMGREIFIPNTGRAINVNQSAGSIRAGGISVSVTGAIEISGGKLIAVLANANRSQTRLT